MTRVLHRRFGKATEEPKLQRAQYTIQSREVNPDNLEVEFIISSYRIDDYGTRFDPDGCDLTQFRKNPVVSYRHMRDGGIYTLPIGRALVGADGDPDTFRKDDQGRLRFVVRFTPEDVFPFGYQVYKLVKERFLNMGSIGADSIRDEIITEANGKKTVVFREWALLEFSVVPIGSNNDALVTKRSAELELTRESILEHEAEVEGVLEGGDFTDEKLANVAESLRAKKQKSAGNDDEVDGEGVDNIVSAECYTSEKGHYVNVKIKREKDGQTRETVYRDLIRIDETPEQVKHREYFEANKDVIHEYRELMGTMYKFLGFKQPANEREAVKGLTKLMASSVQQNRSRKQTPAAPSAEQMRSFCTKLVQDLGKNVRETLLRGEPVRNLDEIVAAELDKAISTL